MAYTVTFWGTRGSIPTPGPHTARYGGNTPCVAVESSGGELVILDAGTGIRALGLELVERQNGAVRAEILLSHAHWDHIQGLPHFKPFFAPGNAVRIWGSRQGTTSLESIERHREHRRVHLLPQDGLERRRALARPPDAHRIARREKRLEVRQSLDMVPMGVRQQDLGAHGAVLPLHQLQPQGANARAGVEDDQLAPGALDGDARRVAAVARRVRSGSGDRAPRPPERHRVGHALRQRDSLALSYGKIWR